MKSLGGIPLGRLPSRTKSPTYRVPGFESATSINGTEHVIDGGTIPTA